MRRPLLTCDWSNSADRSSLTPIGLIDRAVDAHPGSRDDADRPSDRGNRDRPHALLEAVNRDTRIDQPEQQEHAFHGKAPPALEEGQRVVSLRRRLDQQASITAPVGKKWNDW